MAPPPVLFPGKSHGWRSLVGCSPWDREESDRTEQFHFHFSLSCIGEGNSNPLQSSCLENPRNGGAWLAAVYGVTQSWTRLKWVSSSSSSNLKSNHSYLCIIFIYHVCSSWCFKFLYFNNKHMNIQKIMLSENVIPKRLHDVWFHSYNTHEMTKLQKWKTD